MKIKSLFSFRPAIFKSSPRISSSPRLPSQTDDEFNHEISKRFQSSLNYEKQYFFQRVEKENPGKEEGKDIFWVELKKRSSKGDLAKASIEKKPEPVKVLSSTVGLMNPQTRKISYFAFVKRNNFSTSKSKK